MSKTKNKTSAAFATGLGQFSFPNLVTPVLKDRKKPDGPVVYNTMFFFPKGGDTSKKLHKAINDHVKIHFPEGIDDDMIMPIKDGDKAAEKHDKKCRREGKEEAIGKYDFLKGMEFINPWTNAKDEPLQLLDGRNPAPTDPAKREKMFRMGFKGYCFLKINIYNYEGKEGCNLFLEGVQYRESGTIEGMSVARTDVRSLAVDAPGSEDEEDPSQTGSGSRDEDLDDL